MGSEAVVAELHRLRVARGARRGGAALLADRDGTLIADPGYLSDPAAVRLLPHAAACLQRFADAGFALVLVTNQSGVGRGYFTWDDYEAVAQALRDQLAPFGVAFDAEAVCGHGPGVAGCDWRKPAAGMVLAAAKALDLDLGRSVMVGDRLRDLEAGAKAGVGRLVHVATETGVDDIAAVRDSGLGAELLADLSMLAPCAS